MKLARRRRLAWAAVCALMMITVTTPQTEVCATSTAQQSSPPGPDVARNGSSTKTSEATNLDEVLATIKRLEDRVKELEAALAKKDTETSESAKLVKAVQDDVTKLREEKAGEAKTDGGFLSFFRSTELSGFVDAYYGYNFNRPIGDAQLRNFDTKHNQFGFNLAEIALEKKPSEDNRLGFRMDLDFGPATEIVHSYEPGGSDVFRHIQQGYLSFLAPAGKGLQLDVGKFVTPHGAEVIETKDNWNYSRSLLFALAIPYYHFGVRASYPVSDRLALSGFVVNGWNNVVDNNHRKTFGVGATLKPTSKLTIAHNYMSGPDQVGNDKDWRHLWDTTVTYAATPSLSLMANYDYGFDRVESARVHWQGVAAYARYQINKSWAFAPRLEWYDDHDGFTTGARQSLKEFTLTSEHKINGSLLTRFEYRRDYSDKDFFNKPIDRFVRGQSTLAFGLVYVFSSKSEQ
jgi:hypothetical protein